MAGVCIPLRRTKLVFVLLGGLSYTSPAVAEQPKTWTINPTAKSNTVVAALIPDGTDVRNVQVTIDSEGDAPRPAGAGVHHPWETHWDVRRGSEGTFVVVPLPAAFAEGHFIFPKPGKYQLQWLIATGNPTNQNLKVGQTIEIGVSARADSAFLSALSKKETLARLFGDEVPFIRDRESTGVRARNDAAVVEVIRQLLEASIAHEVDGLISDQRTPERAVVWADTLNDLASDFPDSSFSPYAAHFAACCYVGVVFGKATDAVRAARVPGEHKDNMAEYLERVKFFEADARVAKSDEALQFAVDHGDAYLKPLALYQLGFLRACCGRLDETEKLFAQTIELVGERGTVGKMIAAFHSAVPMMKEALAQRRIESKP